jgi:hypothetical protein
LDAPINASKQWESIDKHQIKMQDQLGVLLGNVLGNSDHIFLDGYWLASGALALQRTNPVTSPPIVETVDDDDNDDSEDNDPPPMMARPADDESSVDSDDEDYQGCDWWTGEPDRDYRSPMDNTPLKDMQA